MSIDADQREKLIKKLGIAIGKEVQLHESVLPQLIGGMRIRVGDKLLDTSIRWRLRELSSALLDQQSSPAVLAAAGDVDAIYNRAVKATAG